METAEADEVVAAPAFPHEFHESLGEEDIVGEGCELWVADSAVDLVEGTEGVGEVTEAVGGFGVHQEAVGKAEEDDVVVAEALVGAGRGIYAVFGDARACRLLVGLSGVSPSVCARQGREAGCRTAGHPQPPRHLRPRVPPEATRRISL